MSWIFITFIKKQIKRKEKIKQTQSDSSLVESCDMTQIKAILQIDMGIFVFLKILTYKDLCDL